MFIIIFLHNSDKLKQNKGVHTGTISCVCRRGGVRRGEGSVHMHKSMWMCYILQIRMKKCVYMSLKPTYLNQNRWPQPCLDFQMFLLLNWQTFKPIQGYLGEKIDRFLDFTNKKKVKKKVDAYSPVLNNNTTRIILFS